MKILHVLPRLPYFGSGTVIGGHASSVVSLALEQARQGCEVTILAPRLRDGADWDLPEVAVRWAGSSDRLATRVGLLAAAIPKHVRQLRPDALHMHAGYADYALVYAAMSSSAPSRVWTLYCPWCVRLRGLEPLVARSARQIPSVTAISENVGASIWRATGREATVVHPAVNTDRFAFRPGDDKRRDLLFVGNLMESKNLLNTLRGFAIAVAGGTLPDEMRLRVTTELADSSSDSARAEVTALVEGLGLGSRVDFSGIVSDMPALMRSSAAILVPFRDTRGPSDFFVAALEGLSVGRPVVASSVGAMGELDGTEGLTLCDPNEPTDIARAIVEAVRDPLGDRSLLPASFEPPVVHQAMKDVYASR